MKNLQKSPSVIRRSCTKHGAYDGPYCPECYQKAMGSDEPPVKDMDSKSDEDKASNGVVPNLQSRTAWRDSSGEKNYK